MIDSHQPFRTFSQLQRNVFTHSLFIVLVAFLSCFCVPPAKAQTQTQTVVQKYGKLRVQGNKIVDQTGTPIQLRGMSLYWSQWVPKYWTANTIKWLRDDWKITVVRAAMAVNSGGYATNPTAERNKVIAVVDACIQLGIYVVIDYHDHTASDNTAMAQGFFSDMARRYGNSPNVLFETFNEPLNVSWASVLKPYHQAVISSIRQFAPDNIIICGTRNWSQEVDEAAANPLSGTNIAYTLHFYANTHKQFLRDKAQLALSRGAALFVTEYGTTDATGDGAVNAAETQTWWNFLDANKVSYANWSVADIPESSAALIAGASPDGGWSLSQIKPSGQLVRSDSIAKAPNLSATPPPPPPPTNHLSVSPTALSLDAAAASRTVSVTSNLSWTAASNQSWLTVAPAAGSNNGTLTLNASANTGTASRSATVTVSGSGLTATVSVAQGGTSTPPPPPPGTPCSGPVAATLPKVQNGTGEFCWVTSGNITFINSWNMQLVEVNGVNFTNKWANSLPPRINGNYYIHYLSNVAWAHFEANGN